MASVAPGTITITDNVGWWAKFLKRTHKKELAEISAHYPAIRSLIIDVRKVLDNKYAFEILSQPEKTIGYIQDAVQQENLIILSRGEVPEINIRFINLPRKTPIRDIRQSDLGTAISVEGIARKVTDVRPRITSAVFRCSHCDRALPPVKQRTREFVEPDICPNCDRKGKFDLLLDNCSYIDAQKVRIQEAPEGLRGGQQAQSIDVDISDDLVAQVLPGDRVTVNGILRPVQKVTFGKKSPLFDLYLQANSLEVGEKEFEDVTLSEEDEREILALAQDPEIYNKLVSSIAPTVYGHEKVKAALLLALFGGVSKPMAGADLRGNIHVLILGDPGIAKSVILRYAVNVAPHGIFTTGKTSTGAGLTAAAVKDDFGDGRWTLEAGALVLADGGVCGVDELDKMRKDDRDSLHEAMEQQCYDDQTEVLTDKGWKLFKDLNGDELIATLSPEGYLEYQKPLSFVNADYDGDLYYIKSRQVDLAVTPNHSMYVNLNLRANNWNGFKLIPMDQIPLKRRMRFKKDALWKGDRQETYTVPSCILFGNQHCSGKRADPIDVPMDLWLEFMGYFLSEGSVSRHTQTGVPYRVTISQKKPKSTKIIRQCLERMPFSFTYVNGNFNAGSKQLATHLESFGYQHERFVPDYIKALPPEQIRIFFDALMLGDGSTYKGGSMTYITSSKRLADDVSDILMRLGMAGNVYARVEPGGIIGTPRGETAIAKHGIYAVGVIRERQTNPNINTNRNYHIKTNHYSGKIYCVEVPNHIIYVRRNGIPVWCGNSISISKAGITTTLRSRCSLLAAANPKYGRFSLMDPIADQIDLPPSLVSRFDLIFLIADVPSEATDARISDHILRTQRAGQARVRRAHRVADDEDVATLEEITDVDPLISPEFLRKYISYARRFVFPALTEEANQVLREFYREMRMKASSDPDSPVPVTARQLEALVRLAEASARVRLSNKITAEDAERVTALTLSSLRQICTDDDGNIDVDLLMSGEGKGSRDLKTVIRSLLRQNEGSMRIDDLIESLVAQKFRRDRAERAVEELSQLGELIQPRPNVTVRLI